MNFDHKDKGRFSMKIKIVVFLLTVSSNIFSIDDFDTAWNRMQIEYQSMLNQLSQTDASFFGRLVHPDWRGKSNQVKSFLLGKVDKKFLQNSVLKSSMVRHGYAKEQVFEENYLSLSQNSQVKEILKSFKEVDIGGTSRDCPLYNCNTTSLGHLYYLARVLEKTPYSLKTVVEFGAGYGPLARIAMSTMKNMTYYIIDLPEICAVQYLYLVSALGYDRVKIHHSIPSEFEKNRIHLVPVYFIDKLELEDVDLFISNFAITESTLFTQNLISEKNFFNTKVIYITGLVSSPKWVATQSLIDSIKGKFPRAARETLRGDSNFYEICGYR